MKKLLSILLISLMFAPILMGGKSIDANIGNPGSLQKSLILNDFWMDVNRMNGIFRNNGIWLFDVVANDYGLEWPKGSGLSPVYAGGQYICAKVNGEVRVAGVQHSATEYQPGAIKEDGTADNPLDGAYKWYIIGAGNTGDYANWPVDQGAPLDKDGNPLLLGDKTAFSVWNDLGEHAEYGTNKLGAEIRQTIFAFNRSDAMGDMIFLKWQIVNKSGADWDSTYLAIWMDPDIGDGWDDFVGCDTTLGLGFCYNATNSDQNYGGAPPAVGVDFFQGPIINASGSTVSFPNGTKLEDKAMLGMTSFIYYNNDRTAQGNPFSGADVWNYMTGKWKNGKPITNDGKNGTKAGPATKFMFSGDPESDEGWLDSNEDDRRFIMATGPFNMTTWKDYGTDGLGPDDEDYIAADDDGTEGNGKVDFGEPGVQEIVAAVIVARGSSNLNSVTALKEKDELAQLAYDLNFKLAKAPEPPVVTAQNLPNNAVLTWGLESEYQPQMLPTIDGSPNVTGDVYDAPDPVVGADFGRVTKVFNIKTLQDGDSTITLIDSVITVVDDSTYNFYGYSVYQYSDASGKDPVKIGSWNSKASNDPTPYTGPHFINIKQNAHRDVGTVGAPLINGKEYYFGVVAHGYLAYGSPQVFDSPPTIVTVIPEYISGDHLNAAYNDTIPYVYTMKSNAFLPTDAKLVAKVIDPTQVTGHDYKVFFDQQHYYYDKDGVWKKTAYPDSIGKGLAKPMDVSGSTITGVSYVASATTRELKFTLNVASNDGSWVDGVLLDLPDNINILEAYDDQGVDVVIDHTNNTVMFGRSDTTGFGPYYPTALLTVVIEPTTLPFDVNYIVFDDGWATLYYDDAIIANESSVCTISEESYFFETRKHMNLRDETTGQLVLEDRAEIFPKGSFAYTAPIVDGLQVIALGSYTAPTEMSSYKVDDTVSDTVAYGAYGKSVSYDISDWGIAGFAATGRAIDGYGEGSVDDIELMNDYELRFTGVYDTSLTRTIIDGGDTTIVYYIKEGTGSVATLYTARLYSIADHPMNPNPGSEDPFTVRIPFEVWNKTTGKQVNALIYDRMQVLPDSNTVKFYAFNPFDRVYIWILNTDYSEELAPLDDAETMSHLTWSVYFVFTNWHHGNKIALNYDNKINPGNDEFSFSTADYFTEISAETKKEDLSRVQVVPNPYYGYHSGEMDPYNRWVQFTFLPEKCTIRIFDLAGNLIRKLEKDDATTSLMQWDLENAYELPVASGVYVYHVEAPGIGEKIGKMAIFTPNERLDTY